MTHRIKLIVLWVARSAGFFALFRVLTRSKIRILCYHGGAVGDESNFNPKLFMSAELLRLRMQWLVRKKFSVITLDQAADQLAHTEGRPQLPTVVTFDDGWYSTGRDLIPVMAELGMPSTLYLCTKHFEEGWPVVDVSVRYIAWAFGERSVRITGFGYPLDGNYDCGKADIKNGLCERTERWLLNNTRSRDEVCAALERFAACGGISAGELALNSRRFEYMTGHELRALEVLGCRVELHGHVHRYPVGDPSELRRDLTRCAQVICETGLPASRHYCYPSGEFDLAAVSVLDALNIRTATTCIPGLVESADDQTRFYLPRFLDGQSVSGLEFEAEMSGVAPFLRSLLGRP